MDWLKEYLGEELFLQVQSRLKGNDKVKLTNLAGGEYVSKAKFDAELTKLSELNAQIVERDKQLGELKKTAADSTGLTSQIGELQKANEQATKDWQEKLTVAERDFALKDALKNDYKARDVISVLPHLKHDAIIYKDGAFTGLKEQIDALSKDKAFLFAENVSLPAGTGMPFNPSNAGDGANEWDLGFTNVRSITENK